MIILIGRLGIIILIGRLGIILLTTISIIATIVTTTVAARVLGLARPCCHIGTGPVNTQAYRDCEVV